ncbi:HTH-type transcriptional regulator BhcR [Paracoccus siganidrum]|uniref:IclR family transcriptional regulator n=1 Tax=Paracoccus siganidrum TaxID=1276757 RepID=A0A419A3N3_9RHOB|nr:HTH-type transcriptional regulator BhcR [Paracoccus siganidrum]RJL08325.1 IclR family transcriptional regulator [Paracoccus siganidrum]RMC27528.1 IclR family transcriptional regulator [Paracoccus siganidrum]
MTEPTRRRGRPRSAPEASGTIQALDRALDILDLLAAHPGLTLSEVAEKMEQSPSTVHRVLHTLAARGVAESDPATQTWHIGPATFRLGSAFMRRSGIVERARPVLRALMEHTGETANLGILNGDSVLFVSQAETHETIRAFFPPGTRSPLHASGIGKALLAFGRPETARALLAGAGLQRFTDKTLITVEALAEDMARIRTRGFSFDDEERTRGMRCIAAPVFDLSGEAVAGISVSGPTHRIGQEHVKTLGATVAAAASELSQALGAER